MEKYDLIVIGSGPAGQRAAIQGAKLGKRVALIEKLEVVGGACINTGTIPSKSMREAVMHLSGYQYQGIYGVSYRVKEKITVADLSFRVQQVIKTEIDVTVAQLSRNGIEVLRGAASFVDPHRLQVTTARGQSDDYEADLIVIATGTRPAESPLVPINGRTIINSDQVFCMPSLPKTFIVVGGGVIGVEYASMFAALGVRVILIEKQSRLLSFADQEIVEALCYHLRDNFVQLKLNEEVTSVETTDGKVIANLESRKKISGDVLLYAIGRQGNVDDLNLAAAGLEADNRGRIKVDDRYRTKQEHILAVGDVIGFPSLASVSMEQGRMAVGLAFGAQVKSDPAHYPYGIYTVPEISFVGQTEEQLTEADIPYEVGVAYYREVARGQIRGDTTGRLKLIFHRETREILGVHIIGEGASEILHIGQAVLILKGTLDYFIETVFNYPTLAECYKTAAFNGRNKLAAFG
jgi:NAD(P) transhydrogenase